MSYLFGDVATWLIGKTYNSEDEVAKEVDKSGDKEKDEEINQKEMKEKEETQNEDDKIEDEESPKKGSLENDLEEVSTLAYHKAKDIGRKFV